MVSMVTSMPLSRFCSTVYYKPWLHHCLYVVFARQYTTSHGFHGYITAFKSFLLDSILQAMVSMVTSLPLCHFCSTVYYKPWFPWLHHCLYVVLLYSKLQALVTMVTSAKDCMWCNCVNPVMPNKTKPLLMKAEWCTSHVWTCHFKVVDAMGSTVVTSTSSAMASPPHKVLFTSINWLRGYWGETHWQQTHTCRQICDLISLLSFLESRQTRSYGKTNSPTFLTLFNNKVSV
jgi:hypothetical protein